MSEKINVNTTSADDVLPDDPAELIRSIVGEHRMVKGELLDNMRKDRHDLKKLIDHVMDKLLEGEKIERGVIDAFSAALTTRATQNAAAVRFMDSDAKLLTIIKNVLAQGPSSDNGPDLSQLLEQVEEDDEDSK